MADSGQLVGLPRRDLDMTVETLEAMAGEIGASVIIIKEVEVPAMRTVTKGALGDTRGGVDFSQVDGAMRLPRRRHLLLSPSDDSERDTETPDTDPTTDDGEEPLEDTALVRTSGEAVPLWSYIRDSTPDDDDTFDIEVSSVYKPLPSLRRARDPLQFMGKPKAKKVKPAKPTKSTVKQLPKVIDFEARALERKARREARRDQRKRAVNSIDTNAEATFDMSELDAALQATSESTSAVGDDPLGPPRAEHGTDDGSGPRLIVEALVVRKPANDEVFSTLDDFSFLVG